MTEGGKLRGQPPGNVQRTRLAPGENGGRPEGAFEDGGQRDFHDLSRMGEIVSRSHQDLNRYL